MGSRDWNLRFFFLEMAQFPSFNQPPTQSLPFFFFPDVPAFVSVVFELSSFGPIE